MILQLFENNIIELQLMIQLNLLSIFTKDNISFTNINFSCNRSENIISDST